MKKVFLVLGILVTSLSFSQAIQKGETQVNGGFVLGSGFDFPVYVGIDYGIVEDITIGGQFNFASQDGVTWLGFWGNGNYHFNRLLEIPSEFDIYAGVTLAYNYITTDVGNDGDFDFGGQIGGRYFFADKFGVNAEVLFGSTDDTGFKVGVTYKL